MRWVLVHKRSAQSPAIGAVTPELPACVGADARDQLRVLKLVAGLSNGVAPVMHPDPRSGCGERSSQCSDELLSVQGVNTLHLMLHAREAHWQTPVTDAPLLYERSLLCSDPRLLGRVDL